uniref:Uncharacterized protein n=1 Tax=Anguilla anguilla TaxID=7936 RepID=A0A0E9XI42_ANGAN
MLVCVCGEGMSKCFLNTHKFFTCSCHSRQCSSVCIQ